VTRVVLDTNILVSALWSEYGNPAKIVTLLLEDRIIPCYSSEVIREYSAVLSRPQFRTKFGSNPVRDIISKIVNDGFSGVAIPSTLPFPDEDDRIFYDLAKTCNATLITGNIKHFPSEAFIMKPTDFLQLWGKQSI
jgi:putative PIN family toxin of toxin-antitoxin system